MGEKRRRGRPVGEGNAGADPRHAGERHARALLSTPPKEDGDWDYMKDREIDVAGALLQRKPKKKEKPGK